jgi:type IV pilus assembly protein PilX
MSAFSGATQYYGGATRQRGSALIVALVFLLAMTLIGVTGMQGTTLQERMAGNSRDRNLAFQAAEGVLRSAEDFLRLNSPDENLFVANTAGFYQLNNVNRPDWVGITASNGNGPCSGVPCPSYGTALDNVVAQSPQYFVESMPNEKPLLAETETGTPIPETSYYRVTSRGFGGTADATVVLRSIYRTN